MMRNRGLRAMALAAMLAAIGFCAHARAQTLSELANYSGPDRTARLLAGAKREGTVTLYSSLTLADQSAVIGAFQAKYGIKVQQWRGSSEDIRSRALTEYAAGRFEADVAETSGSEMEPMVREQLLQAVTTPAAASLIPQAIMPHHGWIATRLSVFVGAYNTDIIKPADAPKSYEDLRAPKWKGKLGIESDDNNWLMTMAGVMGEEKAVRLLRDIVTKNGLSVRKGHSLMANMVVSGEVPIALTIYHHEVEPMKRAGAPIAELNLAPEVAFATGAGVARRAPHPHAAVLFLDYLLTEGQQILAARGTLPTSVKYQRLPPEWKLAFMDVPKYMDEAAKWTKLYKDTLAQPR